MFWTIVGALVFFFIVLPLLAYGGAWLFRKKLFWMLVGLFALAAFITAVVAASHTHVAQQPATPMAAGDVAPAPPAAPTGSYEVLVTFSEPYTLTELLTDDGISVPVSEANIDASTYVSVTYYPDYGTLQVACPKGYDHASLDSATGNKVSTDMNGLTIQVQPGTENEVGVECSGA